MRKLTDEDQTLLRKRAIALQTGVIAIVSHFSWIILGFILPYSDFKRALILALFVTAELGAISYIYLTTRFDVRRADALAWKIKQEKKNV